MRYTTPGIDKCWEWIGPNEYPQVSVGGQVVLAHRLMYAIFHGFLNLTTRANPGVEIDHTCGNRKCINPHHLEKVSKKVNVRRGKAAKLDPPIVMYMRALRAEGATLSMLSHRFKLAPATISRVLRGKPGERGSWSDVSGGYWTDD